MAITVYGSIASSGTLRFVSILTANGVMLNFVNVTGSIQLLKDFITFRDNSLLYNGVRGSGAIGFPLVQLEDGTYTRDLNGVLESLGIQDRMEFKR